MKKKSKGSDSSCETSVQSLFWRVGTTRFCGAVWDISQLERRFVVECLVDGLAIELVTADLYEPLLKKVGDGRYGFSFEIDTGILAEAGLIEARLSNIGLPIGLPIFLHQEDEFTEPVLGLPSVEWLGGLRFAGTVDSPGEWSNGETEIIKAIIDGEVVAEARADGWQNNGLLGENARALAAFSLFVPERFADGCVHRVRFVGHAGQQLPGCPLSFVAFADGLASMMAEQGLIESERFRGDMFNRLMPMGRPLSHYAAWCDALPKYISLHDRFAVSAAAIVLVGDGDEEASLSALETQTRQNWVALSLPYCDDAQGFDCEAVRDFLAADAGSCGFIIFAKAGSILNADAIARFEKAFIEHPKAIAAYGDIAITDADGRIWPIAFSAFDYERLLEQGYCCMLFAVRRDALTKVLKAKVLNFYCLFNSLIDEPAKAAVLHLPVCLATISGELNSPAAASGLFNATTAHLRTRGIAAKTTPVVSHLFPAVKVARQTDAPSVTIIIPVRNRIDLLRTCLKSIDAAVKKSGAEIIVVDNESSDLEMLDFLRGFDAPKRHVLRVPGAFNFSKLNNLAATMASTDYLCLLNNDVEALDAFWLNELLSRCAEHDVAAAGAMLIWPSGIVQHGGVVLGPNLGATHAFNDRLSSDPGYADLLRVAHECSAVTAACMVTRRADYLAVGGLDEVFFPINFNDVDYCLKLRANGKRVIFTPHAKLLHLESASRGDHKSAHRKALFERELRNLRIKWLEALLADPFYSPCLSLDPVPFSALAWPLRSMEARWRDLPPQTDVPSGM